MNEVIDFTVARLKTEEGFKQYPYNDATGARVSCLPNGNLTWLYGLNLETEGSLELGELCLRWKLGKLLTSLSSYSWFATCNSARQSALLDIAYNEGVHGLLNFPSMIHYISIKDWPNAQKECSVGDPRLKARYDKLGNILLTGVNE